MTGVLCTVCGAQVYFTKLHTHLKQGLQKYFETPYQDVSWIRFGQEFKQVIRTSEISEF